MINYQVKNKVKYKNLDKNSFILNFLKFLVHVREIKWFTKSNLIKVKTNKSIF